MKRHHQRIRKAAIVRTASPGAQITRLWDGGVLSIKSTQRIAAQVYGVFSMLKEELKMKLLCMIIMKRRSRETHQVVFSLHPHSLNNCPLHKHLETRLTDGFYFSACGFFFFFCIFMEQLHHVLTEAFWLRVSCGLTWIKLLSEGFLIPLTLRTLPPSFLSFFFRLCSPDEAVILCRQTSSTVHLRVCFFVFVLLV